MGKVYLVGAGLGGRAGLTQGALEILRQAEAVWVDELVDERLLAELSPQAQVWRRSGEAGLQGAFAGSSSAAEKASRWSTSSRGIP